MKVSISYPPIDSGKGVPLLSQNRQFQYFHEPTFIYPMVPAYAATLLKRAGYDVIWDDGIAEQESYGQWLADLKWASPDLVMIETKTPVVRKHWRIIDDVKEVVPEAKVALAGDHVTALPRESMMNSKCDFVLTGGDYDFLLLNLVEHLEGKAERLESGIWFRENGKIKSSGSFRLDHDLDCLPFIDRALTKWRLYSEKNGNFKETPGTYTMVGRDCWWRKDGGCAFCSWPTLYPTYRVRKPELLVDEIGVLIEKCKIKEVFDDTGTFPVGNWLRKFAELMIERGYNDEIRFNCNMRFGALTREDFRLMKEAGFRMLLFGVESASQNTLDRLNKGVTIENIIKECKAAREEGLDLHITMMVGYPWESREGALRTLELARMLLLKGWVVTLQSTIVIPYPGTKLYQEALQNDWFRIDPKDYDCFDMTRPILKTMDIPPEEIMTICDEMYKVFLSPRYLFRHLLRTRSFRDLKFSTKSALKVMGHIRDFSRREA